MTDCVIFTEKNKDPSLEPPIVIGFSVLYSVEFVFGLTGNIGVILFTSRNKKLQTVQNMFILNLALADLIVCIFSLPITPITSIYKNWYFGEHMCHSLPWIQGASVFVATFSLTLIAIDRYFMVVTPHKRRMTRVQARFVMICLWLVAILITFPYSWYMELTNYENDGYCGEFCTETWPNASVQRAYTVFVLVAQFFVPFMIMFFCYSRIFKHLKQRTQDKIRKMNERSLILTASMPVLSTVKRKVGTRVDVLEQCRRKCLLLQQTRRNTMILVLVVLFFFVSWFPHNVASMAFEFSDAQLFIYDGTNYIYLISLISHSVAMISIMSNPVLYGLLNRGFVSHLRHGWTSSLRKFKKSETDVSAVLV